MELASHRVAGAQGLSGAANIAGPSRSSGLVVRSGWSSDIGARDANEDFAAIVGGSGSSDVVAAVADGVGGAEGGRVAAELTVREFIDGYFGQGQTRPLKESSGRSLQAINRWVHSIGRRDPLLRGMATTFSAMICSGRQIYVVHVGDTRIYRLRAGQLQQLTVDHAAGPGQLNVLTRAVGADDELRIDYLNLPNEQHDRYLLCSDGVYRGVNDATLTDILNRMAAPEESAQEIVGQAIAARVGDNATAIVLDIVDLPVSDFTDVEGALFGKAIGALPAPGTLVDGFSIDAVLSDSRYVRVLRATDTVDGRQLVMKFPKQLEGADRPMRTAFLREMWIASRVRSPFVGEVVQLRADRQSRLYLAMPFYDGETLEQRLRRRPALSLTAGIDIAQKLARGIVALHRAGIVHRDIKPDNVILCTPVYGQPVNLKLIDFGLARQTAQVDTDSRLEPGTPSYLAPELFEGAPADERSDQFALGVTIYRIFSGRFPYGEIEPFSRPKFRAPSPLLTYRPDLPAWLDRVIGRAISIKPADRYEDVLELIFELEHGADRASPIAVAQRSLYQRNPLRVWKIVSGLLLVLAVAALFAASRNSRTGTPADEPRPIHTGK